MFIDLGSHRAVVVGTGETATEKIDALVACGADVAVVAPDDYHPDHLDGAVLVVGVTSDRDLARRIHDDAIERSMLVNIADVPTLCNFILPAITRRGPITVAVSTAGASPALAQRIRSEVAAHVGEEYAVLAAILDDLRPWVKANLPTYEARRAFFDGIVNGDPDPIELLRVGKRAEVDALLERVRVRAQESGSPS